MTQEQTDDDRREEYLAAQRAAVEAVHVGRETLNRSVQQGEQLSRAENMAEETEYKLDRAGRILRGMTWSGWVANMFTKSVGPPPEYKDKADWNVPSVYESVPGECQETAQAVQNYHANVKVLEACETDEQKETCKVICNSMFDTAERTLGELKKAHPQLEAYNIQFEKDLAVLRNRQKYSQERMRELETVPERPQERSDDPNRSELFGSRALNNGQKSPPKQKMADPRQKEQDDHLAVMAQSLGELGSIAQNLHISMTQQNETIESLDTKADNITEKSRMVTRRADRITQKKSWAPAKPTFHGYVSIRHISSGRYLAALNASDLYLVPKFHPDTCVFGLWKRQGSIFGIKNQHSKRWAGQNLFGSLSCSSSSFGRREEWEAGDEDWSSTRLLCASAGWGAGGYLTVRGNDFGLHIGGCTVEERKRADLWRIEDQQGPSMDD